MTPPRRKGRSGAADGAAASGPARLSARTVELLYEERANMVGEWTVHLLATRRKDGSVTLKVHQRSIDELEHRFRSGRIRTSGAFLVAWASALEVFMVYPDRPIDSLILLVAEALPLLEALHAPLAAHVRDEKAVRRATAVLEARAR